MKKKRIMVAVSMAVGIIMLTASAFANYTNAGGYYAAKEALKKFFKEDNYTLKIDAKFLMDGELLGQEVIEELYDKNGEVKLNHFGESTNVNDGEKNTRKYDKHYQDGEQISQRYRGSSDEAYVSYYISDDPKPYPYVGNMFEIGRDDAEQVDKAIRFGELIADLVVGDLKNNLFLTESTDEKDTYVINLDSYQVPEVVNAGISLIFAEQNRYQDIESMTETEIALLEKSNPVLLLGNDPVISGAKGAVSLDNKGKIVDLSAEVTVTGSDRHNNNHTLVLSFQANVSDYGTTVPQRVNLTGKKIERQSTWMEDRIAEIQKILSSEKLIEEERLAYERELKDLQESLDKKLIEPAAKSEAVIGGAEETVTIEKVD